jgi:hypothetical protein
VVVAVVVAAAVEPVLLVLHNMAAVVAKVEMVV